MAIEHGTMITNVYLKMIFSLTKNSKVSEPKGVQPSLVEHFWPFYGNSGLSTVASVLLKLFRPL